MGATEFIGGIETFGEFVGELGVVGTGDAGVEFAKGLGFDLADTFAGQADFLADLLEGERLAARQAETQSQNRRFAFVDGVEQFVDGFDFIIIEDGLIGGGGTFVVEHFAEREGVAFAVDRGLGGSLEGPDGVPDHADFFGGHLHGVGQFIDTGLAMEFGFQFAGGAFAQRDEFDHVGGDVDGLDGVDEGAFDGLLDPPGGVGAEARALGGVETFDGFEQAEVALFDEVDQGQAAVAVVLGDGNDEAQIGARHAIAGFRTAMADDAPCEFFFFIGGQQRHFVDLPKIDLQTRWYFCSWHERFQPLCVSASDFLVEMSVSSTMTLSLSAAIVQTAKVKNQFRSDTIP